MMINEKKKGFVVLLAVLLAGLFAVVGASIFSISIRELILSSGGKESQYAFYAADSGMECALYWDLKHQLFATSSHSASSPSQDLYCNGVNVVTEYQSPADNPLKFEWKKAPTSDNSATTVFGFELYPNDSSRSDCTKVYVYKNQEPGPPTNPFITTIESRGYNTCDENNPRRVERALKATYGD